MTMLKIKSAQLVGMLAQQHPHDLVWLSCYVSITITHIADRESSANSQASVSIANRLAAS